MRVFFYAAKHLYQRVCPSVRKFIRPLPFFQLLAPAAHRVVGKCFFPPPPPSFLWARYNFHPCKKTTTCILIFFFFFHFQVVSELRQPSQPSLSPHTTQGLWFGKSSGLRGQKQMLVSFQRNCLNCARKQNENETKSTKSQLVRPPLTDIGTYLNQNVVVKNIVESNFRKGYCSSQT